MDEITFLNEKGIMVTNKRFVTGSKTFAIQSITSIRRETDYKQRNYFGIGAVVCGGFLFLSLASSVKFETVGHYFLLITLILLTPLLGYCAYTCPPQNTIIVSSGGADIQALVSEDFQFVERIVKSVGDAISSRG